LLINYYLILKNNAVTLLVVCMNATELKEFSQIPVSIISR
jgi:hypothetical protein